MEPTSTLIQSWADPQNTTRARYVAQMYDVYFTIPQFDFTHDVGLSVNIPQFSLIIRNRTVNTELESVITLPAFLTSTDALTFQLMRNANKVITIRANGSFIDNRLQYSIEQIIDHITVTVEPMNISGPVYIRTDLAPISESIV